MNLKQRLLTATSDKRKLQKRSIRIKKSLDEVHSLLNSMKKKK